MPPGPRIPFQGGMGPRMMGPRMMGPRMMGTGMNPMQGQSFLNPRMMGGVSQGRSGGGFLAKLLGNLSGGGQGAGRAAAGLNAMNPAAASQGGGGGLMSLLSNPNSINGFLNNTQQVLKTAQSIGPMLQQYGPLVKNLPAMWRLYKGMKDAPTDEEVQDDETNEQETEQPKQSLKKKRIQEIQSVPDESDDISPSISGNPNQAKKGASVPKLYI